MINDTQTKSKQSKNNSSKTPDGTLHGETSKNTDQILEVDPAEHPGTFVLD